MSDRVCLILALAGPRQNGGDPGAPQFAETQIRRLCQKDEQRDLPPESWSVCDRMILRAAVVLPMNCFRSFASRMAASWLIRSFIAFNLPDWGRGNICAWFGLGDVFFAVCVATGRKAASKPIGVRLRRWRSGNIFQILQAKREIALCAIYVVVVWEDGKGGTFRRILGNIIKPLQTFVEKFRRQCCLLICCAELSFRDTPATDGN